MYLFIYLRNKSCDRSRWKKKKKKSSSMTEFQSPNHILGMLLSESLWHTSLIHFVHFLFAFLSSGELEAGQYTDTTRILVCRDPRITLTIRFLQVSVCRMWRPHVSLNTSPTPPDVPRASAHTVTIFSSTIFFHPQYACLPVHLVSWMARMSMPWSFIRVARFMVLPSAPPRMLYVAAMSSPSFPFVSRSSNLNFHVSQHFFSLPPPSPCLPPPRFSFSTPVSLLLSRVFCCAQPSRQCCLSAY